MRSKSVQVITAACLALAATTSGMLRAAQPPAVAPPAAPTAPPAKNPAPASNPRSTPAAPPVADTGPARQSFQQEIPAAAFKFDMLPIPASADGKIKPIWISKCEITWEAFDAFVYRLDEDAGKTTPKVDAVTRPSKPYLPPDRGFGHEGYAAICMSYKTAQAFCDWLSAHSGKKYRLPTEDEWEYACLAGSKGDYSFGADAGQLNDFAWFTANGENKTHPVGKKKPNAWGFSDMHGNVAEWVTGRDGKPATKGGSFLDAPEKLKASANEASSPKWNASDPQVPKSAWWLADGPFVGFRIVCEGPLDAAAPADKPKDARPQTSEPDKSEPAKKEGSK
ncbi:MAG: formylglycine-generating enzyme family protein [Phycisphaerales bacterium]